MKNEDWGVAAMCLMLSLLDLLEVKGLITDAEGREVFLKSMGTIAKLAKLLKQSEMKRAVVLLRGIYGEALENIEAQQMSND